MKPVTLSGVRRSNGVVLPIVLVVLVLLTALVVTQVRRTTIDQRMAANAQESVALDGAAKAVLGWCEVDLQRANRGIGTMPQSILAPASTAVAAWRVPANWGVASAYTPSTGAQLLATATFATCLIEDASEELEGDISNNSGSAGVRDCRWRKYRTTAQVQAPAPDLPGGVRAYFAQGEMRLYSQLPCI